MRPSYIGSIAVLSRRRNNACMQSPSAGTRDRGQPLPLAGACVMSRGIAQRLLTFLPPRGALFEDVARGSLSAASVVDYGGIDASQEPCSGGNAPLSLLPKAMSVDL